MKATKYTINWDILINIFNRDNISQLTQARIALVYGVTMTTISNCKYRAISIDKINKIYRPLYDIHFKSIIELDDILVKESVIKKLKPIHKFNNGNGATICHKCSKIISIGMTSDLYCSVICKSKHLNDYGKESNT